MTYGSPVTIAQVTDLHLFASDRQELLGLPTAQSFQAVLDRLMQLRSHLDLILLTGDLAQDGQAESYQRLQTWLKPLGIPTYLLPGNHDNPMVMQQVLQESPISSEKSFNIKDWNLVLLNSAVPGQVHGYLSEGMLSWLERELQRLKARPTLIAFHHPPFTVGSTWLDGSALQNAEAFFKVIDSYPHVKLVVFGHIHQEFDRQRRGVRYLGCPSTCIQFEPQSAQFALDHEVPGFRLINLYPDGVCKTKVERVNYACQPDFAALGY